jgi:hypothetical protein
MSRAEMAIERACPASGQGQQSGLRSNLVNRTCLGYNGMFRPVPIATSNTRAVGSGTHPFATAAELEALKKNACRGRIGAHTRPDAT